MGSYYRDPGPVKRNPWKFRRNESSRGLFLMRRETEELVFLFLFLFGGSFHFRGILGFRSFNFF